MKLKDLLKVVDPMQDITLEISELTAPEGFYAKDIPKMRPIALEMEVEDVHTVWYHSMDGVYAEDSIESSLGVVVTGGKK